MPLVEQFFSPVLVTQLPIAEGVESSCRDGVIPVDKTVFHTAIIEIRNLLTTTRLIIASTVEAVLQLCSADSDICHES